MEASPYPRDYPQDNIYIAGDLVHGWEIGRYENPPMAGERLPPQSPQHRERCPQNMFDPILKKFATSFDSVDLRYRHRFKSLVEEDAGVIADLEDLDRNTPVRTKPNTLSAVTVPQAPYAMPWVLPWKATRPLPTPPT